MYKEFRKSSYIKKPQYNPLAEEEIGRGGKQQQKRYRKFLWLTNSNPFFHSDGLRVMPSLTLN